MPQLVKVQKAGLDVRVDAPERLRGHPYARLAEPDGVLALGRDVVELRLEAAAILVTERTRDERHHLRPADGQGQIQLVPRPGEREEIIRLALRILRTIAVPITTDLVVAVECEQIVE